MTQSRKVWLYDTTLRDGSQRKGISFSVEDKLKITTLLDNFGLSYIEGGWPGSNPKDAEYFRRVKELPLKQAKIAAFGSTRRSNASAAEDANLQALLAAGTPVVTLVGKSSKFHVTEILRTTLESNLEMIADSISWLKAQGKEVVYDAEHFFDGYREDPEYALATLERAHLAGADWIVLCDTNGGSLPNQITEIVGAVTARVQCPLGIHAHNDSELAAANSLAAVQAGCNQVQGTINGYGERCGNANLVSILATLQLKLGIPCVPAEKLSGLTQLARKISGIANLNPDEHAAYVGSCAFAHKGGIHVAAVEKNSSSYEHVEPEAVGNSRNVVVSELAGRGNIRVRASELGVQLQGNEKMLLDKIKQLEARGFQFENAEGTFELMLRKERPDYKQPFEIIDMMEVIEQRAERTLTVNAVVKIRVGNEVFHTASEGEGPVHAIDNAMRKALLPAFPELSVVKLCDYKVRILDPQEATAATTRVTIEAKSNGDRWTTVGCSDNLIEASFHALADSYELFLLRKTQGQ